MRRRSRLRFTGLLAAAMLAASPTGAGSTGAAAPAAAAPRPPALSPGQRLRLFDQVWEEIRDRYYDPGFNGVDWDQVRARYRPRVEAAADDAAFNALLRAMVGELRDAHTRILSADQVRDRREQRTTTAGVILFEVEGQPAVFEVRANSPAAAAGLRPGQRVLAVDGVPVGAALARARAEVGPSSSDRAALILSYLRLVAGRADAPLRLSLDARDGGPAEVVLTRRALPAAPQFEARLLPSGHAYVRFDRFRAPVARRLRAALEAYRDAPGLILDLRSNTGGDGEEGMRAVAPLLDRPTLVARLATRTGRAPSALLGLVRLPLELSAGAVGRQLYSGPLVILTNPGTASTSEVIAAALQERGRAKVVGTRSCGCALGVLRHRRLSNGAALAISEVGLVTGLGRRIEGEGVAPDLAVEPRLADLRDGRDAALEAAVRLLAGGAR
ncbi:MAG TPA: S41 family peptidase [Allosphingosinicella sp.]|nr:S41 family peptidase [Allosphingosinicella sp.]